ncbi:MAG: hypothetical protein QM785_13645 [Pyrinomonadaceae bacterium]
MIEVLEEENWFYSFEHDTEMNEYFLDVVCGTVAVFTIRIKLNQKELTAFRADPTSIRALAYDVLDHPHDFNSRAIR